MSLKNDKTLNSSLIAFNNHIVGMKPVVKKAKVNEIQKLIRKIKLFTNKKGTEEQLAKNKKKCENLQNEIKEIKSLKFNDIAIFSIENESASFENHLKANKGLTSDKIALARVGFHKLVLDAINKMKTDPKIDGWKRTFIQYKARAEKRRNWKEKNQQLKEIESKLKLNEEELKELENQEEKEENVDEETKIITEKKDQKVQIVKEKSNKSKKEKQPISKIKERKVKFSDDESSSDESADLSEDELAEYNTAKINPPKFSDGESIMEDDDDDDGEENFPNVELHFSSEDESESKSEIEYEVEKFEKPKVEEKQLKPLVIENKPSKMEIKQINLDEIKDFSEIPIADIVASDNEDDKKLEDESKEPTTTISLNSDPFFLDEDGREIYNSRFDDLNRSDTRSYRSYNDRSYNDRPYNDRSYNDRPYNRNNSNFRNDSNKEAYRNKRDSLNSSFKSSLSNIHHNNDNYNRRDNDRNGFNRRDNDRNGFNRRDDDRNTSYKRPNNFNDNNDRDHKRPSFNKNYSNDSRPQFKDRGSFDKNNSSFNRNYNGNTKSIESKPEDPSKLHPSWQAKKLMEEKLKAMKFEGKKVKFDDDE